MKQPPLFVAFAVVVEVAQHSSWQCHCLASWEAADCPWIQHWPRGQWRIEAFGWPQGWVGKCSWKFVVGASFVGQRMRGNRPRKNLKKLKKNKLILGKSYFYLHLLLLYSLPQTFRRQRHIVVRIRIVWGHLRHHFGCAVSQVRNWATKNWNKNLKNHFTINLVQNKWDFVAGRCSDCHGFRRFVPSWSVKRWNWWSGNGALNFAKKIF